MQIYPRDAARAGSGQDRVGLIRLLCRRTYISGMPTTKKPPKGTLRSWRVSILRQRAQVLGSVKAKDERTAEAAAVAEFNLNDEQRQRLAVREDWAND